MVFRIALALIAMVVIWRTTGGFFDTAGYQPLPHLLHGLLASAAVLTVTHALLRLDGLPWTVIGRFDPSRHARAFFGGAALWLLPAGAGLALCVSLGWVQVGLVSSPSAVLATLATLLPGVLLIEALPEELAFRGYVQGLLGRRMAHWLALLLQALAFSAFAWAVGAIDSVQQLMFLPGLAVILGLVRAMSANTWTSIGMHTAWMTTTQLLGPMHGHFEVINMLTLQFVAFALLPATVAGVVLDRLRPDFNWKDRPVVDGD